MSLSMIACLKWAAGVIVISLFVIGCGAEGSDVSVNDDEANIKVNLTTETVPLPDGNEVTCVVAQGNAWDVSLTCNWESIEQTVSP